MFADGFIRNIAIFLHCVCLVANAHIPVIYRAIFKTRLSFDSGVLCLDKLRHEKFLRMANELDIDGQELRLLKNPMLEANSSSAAGR